jgi:ubiquitin carboxyl-terminal hydrolase 34
MRPYKVEHFIANSEKSPEDVFELVGVLVHSGTAESGHYYSFIRERPSNSDKENWVEFNDDTVTPWDPNCMEGSCFGGVDYRGPIDGGNLQYDKSYSAYMLFYQRSRVLSAQKQTLERQELLSPIRLPIVPRLANQIAMENEVLMRKYCLYDPSHAAFVAKMLSNIKQINKGQCSQSHTLEKDVLMVSLNHLDQVVARTKDLPDFPTFMLTVGQICHSCPECSRDFLEWFCDYPDTLRHLLLRNPDVLVRTEIASSILLALVKVKADASYAYGLGDDEDSVDGLEGGDPQLIQRVVKSISRLWDIFHSNCRAWPEYFGLLASIANLGTHEAVLLLDEHFLRRTLDIISADPLLNLTPQYSRMLNIISKRIATRPVSYDSVISLLQKLIVVVDPVVDQISDHKDRIELSIDGDPVPLANGERHLLTQHWTRSQAHILVEKLLQIHQNLHATRQILIILLHWPDNIDPYIYQAIILGIRKGTSTAPCAPFLRAALTYCEESELPRAILNMVSHVAKVAGHLDNAEGREFLHFLKDVLELPTNHNGIPKEEIFQYCLDQVAYFGPGLLTYYDNTVRTETEDFLHDIILRHGPDADSGPSPIDVEKSNAIVLAAQKLGVACLDFLQEAYIRQRQQAVRATLINIQSVIESCSKFFDEENDDPLTIRFVDQRACKSIFRS